MGNRINGNAFTFGVCPALVGGEAGFSPSLTISMQTQSSTQLYPPSLLSASEFTKRKRWANLLITELREAIILIISPQCQILYCGATVRELKVRTLFFLYK